MAEIFDINSNIAWSWITPNKKYQRLPNNKRSCGHCYWTQHNVVENWINEKGLLK